MTALQRSLLRRCVLPRHGRHRHRVFLVLNGGMKEFGCIVIRCYTHHLTKWKEDHRRPVFGKVARPVHDRLRSNQSGQRRQPAPVRPVATDRSDRSHQRPGKAHSPRQIYRVKEKKEEVQPTIDPEKAKADDVVQIAISKWLSMMRVQDRWFLVNRSILLSKG